MWLLCILSTGNCAGVIWELCHTIPQRLRHFIWAKKDHETEIITSCACEIMYYSAFRFKLCLGDFTLYYKQRLPVKGFMSKECRLLPFPYIPAFVCFWMGLFSPCPLSAGSGFVFMWGGRVACKHVRFALSVSMLLPVLVILHVQLVLSLDLWPVLSKIPKHSGKPRRDRKRTEGEIERGRQAARKNEEEIKRRVSGKTDDKNRSRRDRKQDRIKKKHTGEERDGSNRMTETSREHVRGRNTVWETKKRHQE